MQNCLAPLETCLNTYPGPVMRVEGQFICSNYNGFQTLTSNPRQEGPVVAGMEQYTEYKPNRNERHTLHAPSRIAWYRHTLHAPSQIAWYRVKIGSCIGVPVPHRNTNAGADFHSNKQAKSGGRGTPNRIQTQSTRTVHPPRAATNCMVPAQEHKCRNLFGKYQTTTDENLTGSPTRNQNPVVDSMEQ